MLVDILTEINKHLQVQSFFICIWQLIGLQKRKAFYCITRLMLKNTDQNCSVTQIVRPILYLCNNHVHVLH